MQKHLYICLSVCLLVSRLVPNEFQGVSLKCLMVFGGAQNMKVLLVAMHRAAMERPWNRERAAKEQPTKIKKHPHNLFN